MASSFVLAVILMAAFACGGAEEERLVGGWVKHSVDGDPLYAELAHFAISKQKTNRDFFDTVLELTAVESQVVTGATYRLTFKTAESTCRVTETYTKERCLPKTGNVKDICTAVIYVPLEEPRAISSFTCDSA
ncbi:hypothetical protein V5799_029251 [Amblyomma americanum]|uniref:Cystatin domain-containing protein n=1 Tax=Amblyomma americanum TaxID=6943 RepID=A0AAQ4ERJ2_AMBAM